MKSYPIWNDVTACIYKSSKSFGAKDESTNRIYVGSSKSNSHKLATVTTKKHILDDCILFELKVNGFVVNQIRFENKNNVPGEKISEVNLLDSMYEDQAHRTFYASNL